MCAVEGSMVVSSAEAESIGVTFVKTDLSFAALFALSRSPQSTHLMKFFKPEHALLPFNASSNVHGSNRQCFHQTARNSCRGHVKK